MFKVDLNCDLGESFGVHKVQNQNDILKYVTSANIACGFHSGDASIMRETVEVAIKNNVKIGAHPGLPDLTGFGRREMNITPQEAYDIVIYQIGALDGVLRTFGETMQHVKPHGALYNMAAKDPALAEAIAKAVYDISPSLILFGLSGSELAKAGENIGLKTAHEVFADRTYQSDGTLTSRTKADALITNTNQATNQVLQMIKENTVMSQQQIVIPLRAHTICIHGDGANALAFTQNIKAVLETNEVSVEAIERWKEDL